jgi:hypothetical protein
MFKKPLKSGFFMPVIASRVSGVAIHYWDYGLLRHFIPRNDGLSF